MNGHCAFPSQRSLVTLLKINSWKGGMGDATVCKETEPSPKVPFRSFPSDSVGPVLLSLKQQVSPGAVWSATQTSGLLCAVFAVRHLTV